LVCDFSSGDAQGFAQARFFGKNRIEFSEKVQQKGGTMAEEEKTTEPQKEPEEEKAIDQEEVEPEAKASQEPVGEAEEGAAETRDEKEVQDIEEAPEGPTDEEAPELGAKEAELKKPLEKMTAKELREVALGIPEISGVHAMKKEELLAAIRKAWGIEAEKAPKKAKERKAAVSVADLKAKIQTIKVKRAEAIQRRDKRMAKIYRRMISRLKKRTRRAA
jgi:hypothetical protein